MIVAPLYVISKRILVVVLCLIIVLIQLPVRMLQDKDMKLQTIRPTFDTSGHRQSADSRPTSVMTEIGILFCVFSFS